MVRPAFQEPDRALNEAIRRKRDFCGNQQSSNAPVSLQKLLSHLETDRFAAS
jgi:hypothetical protein